MVESFLINNVKKRNGRSWMMVNSEKGNEKEIIYVLNMIGIYWKEKLIKLGRITENMGYSEEILMKSEIL